MRSAWIDHFIWIHVFIVKERAVGSLIDLCLRIISPTSGDRLQNCRVKLKYSDVAVLALPIVHQMQPCDTQRRKGYTIRNIPHATILGQRQDTIVLGSFEACFESLYTPV